MVDQLIISSFAKMCENEYRSKFNKVYWQNIMKYINLLETRIFRSVTLISLSMFLSKFLTLNSHTPNTVKHLFKR